jgi:hypothetical protein
MTTALPDPAPIPGRSPFPGADICQQAGLTLPAAISGADTGDHAGPAGSADYAEGQQRGAATLHQPGDLMPVDMARVHLGQRCRDTETDEP